MEKDRNVDQKVLLKKNGIKTGLEFLGKKIMPSVTNIDSNKTLFISCDCRNEVLLIEYDHELKIADFSIFYSESSAKNQRSWFQKIRYIWKILKDGIPYKDQIILNEKQLKEIKCFLSSIV